MPILCVLMKRYPCFMGYTKDLLDRVNGLSMFQVLGTSQKSIKKYSGMQKGGKICSYFQPL